MKQKQNKPTILSPTHNQIYLYYNGLSQATRQDKIDFIQRKQWAFWAYFTTQPQGDAPGIEQRRRELAWQAEGLAELVRELDRVEQLRMKL